MVKMIKVEDDTYKELAEMVFSDKMKTLKNSSFDKIIAECIRARRREIALERQNEVEIDGN